MAPDYRRIIGMQDVVAAVAGLHPLGVRQAEIRRRPHADHIGTEAERQREWPHCRYLEEHHRSRGACSASRKHVLLHGERRVRISNGGALRVDLDGRGVIAQFDGNRVAGHFRGDAKAAGDFHGKYPRLKRSVALPEDRTRFAGHRKRHARLSGPRHGERAGAQRKSGRCLPTVLCREQTRTGQQQQPDLQCAMHCVSRLRLPVSDSSSHSSTNAALVHPKPISFDV